MPAISIEVIRAAYDKTGFLPCQGEWYRFGEPCDGSTEPVYLACPQTTILESLGLIPHHDNGVNIESVAETHWGAAYAWGFRDGWDGLNGDVGAVKPDEQSIADYERGFADGEAAVTDFLN